jgi:hypothetical protein
MEPCILRERQMSARSCFMFDSTAVKSASRTAMRLLCDARHTWIASPTAAIFEVARR